MLPDWQFRLGVSSVTEYIHEAALAGLVCVQVRTDSQRWGGGWGVGGGEDCGVCRLATAPGPSTYTTLRP